MKIIFALTLALLFGGDASAAKLYLSEYRALGSAQTGAPQIALEPGTDQAPIDFTAGAVSSAVFASSTRFVRVVCDVSCSIVFGPSPQTATVNNKLLGAGAPEYFGVTAGQLLSVRTNP